MKRAGNNPKRRIAPAAYLTEARRTELAARAHYAPSGHHKRYPADYRLDRTSPRPTKSLCDLKRIVLFEESKSMLRKAILCGMFSDYFLGEYPKYVWCIGEDGEVYEAKTEATSPGGYHGYPLEEDDDFRDLIKRIWKERCPQTGQ